MTIEEREDAIDIIQSILNKYEEDECLVTEITIGDEDIKAFKMAIEALAQEPRKGHWISHREHCEMNNLIPSGLGSYFWCSECDCGIDSKYFHRVNYNFCPNCGAKMEEVEE